MLTQQGGGGGIGSEDIESVPQQGGLPQNGSPPPPRWGLACPLGCVVLICSWRRLLADRQSLPFPETLSLRRWWCPSASHHPVPFLFLLGLSFPLYFPFVSLGRLCQQSPRTFPVSLLCVGSTQRRATALTVG